MKKNLALAFSFLCLSALPLFSAQKKVKVPTWVDSPDGKRELVLPDEVDIALQQTFPGYKIPPEADFNPDMLKYYHSQLIGVHPAVMWGDFNGDKKRDYAFMLITMQSKWGPVVEFVVLNAAKKGGEFDVFTLGEVNGYKDDFIRFDNNKLTKGKFQKGGWYINWNAQKAAYTKIKD
jgi:hypothetical protein